MAPRDLNLPEEEAFNPARCNRIRYQNLIFHWLKRRLSTLASTFNYIIDEERERERETFGEDSPWKWGARIAIDNDFGCHL